MKKIILMLAMTAGFALQSKASFPMPGYRLAWCEINGTRHTTCSGNSTDCGTAYYPGSMDPTYIVVVTYINGDHSQIYEKVKCTSLDIQPQSDGSTIYIYKPVN